MVKTPKSDTRRDNARSWLLDGVVGGGLGGLLGAIAAVNVVIYSGVGGGYEANLGDVFQHNIFVGIAVVAILVAGPVLGVFVARRRRGIPR